MDGEASGPAVGSSHAAHTSPIEALRVDGVPVLLRHAAEGATVACLRFRVGIMDEPLPLRGVSHLVEHLTLSTLGQQPYEYNGGVRASETDLVCRGTPEQVTDFLRRVCTVVADLPTARLPAEQRVLRTEAQGRRVGLPEAVLRTRYGPNSYGLLGYDELLLHRPCDDDVRRWAERAFQAGNAALWISGPAPAELHLPLPHGDRLPLPPQPKTVPVLPGWLRIGEPVAVVSMVVPRSAATAALARHLDRRLRVHLREDLGLSYRVGASLQPLDTDQAHLLLHADGLPDAIGRVHDALQRTVAALAESGPSEQELRRDHEMAARAVTDPAGRVGWLDNALSHLLAQRTFAPLEHLQQLEELDGPALAVTLQQHLEGGIHLLGDPAPRAALPCPPLSWPRPVIRTDRRHVLKVGRFEQRHPDAPTMLSGEEGLVLTGPQGTVAVRFSDVRAAEMWNGGMSVLYAADGTCLTVDPSEWQHGGRIADLITRFVPAGVRVPIAAAPPPRRQVEPHRPTPAGRVAALLVLAVTIVVWMWVRQATGLPATGVTFVGIGLAVAVGSADLRRFTRRRGA